MDFGAKQAAIHQQAHCNISSFYNCDKCCIVCGQIIARRDLKSGPRLKRLTSLCVFVLFGILDTALFVPCEILTSWEKRSPWFLRVTQAAHARHILSPVAEQRLFLS